jgi:hypothetical protein
MHQVADDRSKPYHRAEVQSGPILRASSGGGWRRHFRVFDGRKKRHNIERSWPAITWALTALVMLPLAAGLMS